MYLNLIICWLFCLNSNVGHSFHNRSTGSIDELTVQNEYKSRMVAIQSHPYQVLVLTSAGKYCAGNIIGVQWILTPAHCRAPHMKVYVGSKHGLEGDVYHVNVQKSPTHFLYTAEYKNPHYDIMVLELRLALEFSPTVNAVKLSNSTEDIVDGTIGTLTGWGAKILTERSSFYYFLRKLEFPIITHEECKSTVIQTMQQGAYTGPDPNNRDLLCTENDGLDVEKCILSTGAGLVTKVGKEVVLVGISMNSVGCDSYRKRDVYVSILFARQWIYDICGV